MIRLVPSWASQYEEFWDAIRKRNMWFIKLRYGAVLMLTTFILASDFFLGFKFEQSQILAISIITLSILIYNAILHVGKKHIKSIAGQFNPLHLSLIQIILDFTALFLLVHFTGGIETPLYMLFVFHMIIGSLVLPGSIIYTVATVVVLGFGSIIFSEYLRIIPHYTIQGFLNTKLYDDFNYIISIFKVFSFTMYISVYLANGIARQLYKMEQDLIESLDRLNTAEIEKQRYIVGIVHEIKTPLTAVHSYLNLMLQKFLGPLDEKVEEKLKRAADRSEEAINLINDVIKVSRFKLFNQFLNEEIDVAEIMTELADQHMANAESKKIKLIFNYERKSYTNLLGDKFLFSLAISNLIGNAIKYVDREGRVEVSVDDNESEIIISICDDGIGIPANELDKIFIEFFRSSRVSKDKQEGAGIGLAIVKQIIEKHNGKITVESPSRLASKDKPGTCFKVQIPKNIISSTKNGGKS
ncbi:MAG: HAMP domain-containing histidine kinase [Ignavibacteriaceae bacterium]|nr:HAMP domain-containing histidine kinase [Ignavibacteriaceae bacterium]